MISDSRSFYLRKFDGRLFKQNVTFLGGGEKDGGKGKICIYNEAISQVTKSYSSRFALDVAGTGLPSSPTFTQQGLLPEIQRLWRSFDSKIMLWRYDDPGVQEVTEYTGVGGLSQTSSSFK